MHIKRVDIKIGASDDSYTEVISDKIKEGDRILVGMRGGKNKKSGNMRVPRL